MYVRALKALLPFGCLALAILTGDPTLEDQADDQVVAIVGATLIDGKGGQPVPDASILIVGKRIKAVGPRSSVQVPSTAKVIDGAGKFLTPGFIDSNVHVSMFGNLEQLARFEGRNDDVTLENAQLFLKSGVTTVRDS